MPSGFIFPCTLNAACSSAPAARPPLPSLHPCMPGAPAMCLHGCEEVPHPVACSSSTLAARPPLPALHPSRPDARHVHAGGRGGAEPRPLERPVHPRAPGARGEGRHPPRQHGVPGARQWAWVTLHEGGHPSIGACGEGRHTPRQHGVPNALQRHVCVCE